MAQASGIIHVLVSGEAAEHRLPKHSNESMAAVLAPARIGERIACNQRSQIGQSAHKINAGQMPDLSAPQDATDFYFVSASAPDIAVTRLNEIVKERNP